MREGEKTAADLEWPRLLELVADGAASDKARLRLLALWPADDIGEARRRTARTAAALEALALAEPVPAPGVPEVDDALERLERGGALTLEELAEMRRVLLGARMVRTAACRDQVPLLREILAVDPGLERPLASLERSLDERGGLADGASPELSRVRSRLVVARRQLTEELSRQAARLDDVLREQSWVERDGRYGLPVRADAHRRVEGIILGSSATGATLYVEPPAVTALSNKLRLAEAEVEREEARILAALSRELSELIEPLGAAYEICIEADVLAAISRFAQEQRAIAIEVRESPRIALERVRHPLLARQGIPVVPNDIVLESGQALVISGPNAGGKTVALKCLGLSVWMARSGLPIPVAEGSEVGFFDCVLTGIGDEQSIERSLSTFSAEVKNLAAILGRANGGTLVLLDEVAGGTDPDEGSALAAAVLEGLVARGAAVAVTTHYERLKELPADDPRFVNGSVGFDFEAMQPTFTFTLGLPGASSALAVATRFGMPPAVIGRARERLSKVALRREELLAQLERERRLASEARAEAQRDAEAARQLLEDAERERSAVRDKERSKIAAETSSLVARVRQARAQLDAVSKDLDSRSTTVREAERAVDEAAQLAAVGGPLDRLTRAEAPPARAVAVGDTVYVRKLGSTAIVEEAPSDGEVRVRAGAFSLRVALSDLGEAASGAKKKAPQPKGPKKTAPAPVAIPERVIRTSSNTCDLRGMRVEEAVEVLDRFLDDCASGANDEVAFALHGHGTGALKRAIRDHLALSSRVASSRPAEMEEGGDAFTVFRVRG